MRHEGLAIDNLPRSPEPYLSEPDWPEFVPETIKPALEFLLLHLLRYGACNRPESLLVIFACPCPFLTSRLNAVDQERQGMASGGFSVADHLAIAFRRAARLSNFPEFINLSV